MTNLSDTLAALSEAATKEAGDIAFYSGGSLYTPAQSKFYEALAEAYRTGQLVPVPSVDPLRSALIDRLGYAERAEKAAALLRLLHDESPAAISADDPRLEPFCDDYYPTDTFNALCDIELIDQIGSADFDDYRAVLLPDGVAIIAAMQEGRDG